MSDGDDSSALVILYWLPLGAGGHSVKYNGRVYEALVAAMQRRPRMALYHAALEVVAHGERYVLELAPALPADQARQRGVVMEGAVGSRLAGRSRIFRYQLRCWNGGVIADAAEAVDSPIVLSRVEEHAARVLRLAPTVPSLVWGRDEIGVGDMWNSNSVVSWLLEMSGIGADVAMPTGGRAPGWDAGTALARRMPSRARVR